MPIRVSPVSRAAALMIIIIGIFTLSVGIESETLESSVAGTAFVVLGAVLYWLLYAFTKKLRREVGEE